MQTAGRSGAPRTPARLHDRRRVARPRARRHGRERQRAIHERPDRLRGHCRARSATKASASSSASRASPKRSRYPGSVTVQARIEQKLATALTPQLLVVENESHMHSVKPGSETHFKVLVVSPEFDGASRVARQRRVNDLLRDELASGVHALTMRVITPEEYASGRGRRTFRVAQLPRREQGGLTCSRSSRGPTCSGWPTATRRASARSCRHAARSYSIGAWATARSSTSTRRRSPIRRRTSVAASRSSSLRRESSSATRGRGAIGAAR